jgi:hypothetical protein
MGVHIDCQPDFQHHVHFIFSREVALPRLIPFVIFSFSTRESVEMLYFNLVRMKLAYASVGWNCTRIIYSDKPERILKNCSCLPRQILFHQNTLNHDDYLL